METLQPNHNFLLHVFVFCYCYSLLFNFKVFYLIFLHILLILCGDIEVNPGPCRTRNKCRVLYHNIRGLKTNLNDLQIASRNYDIIFCSETLVSQRRHVSEILLQGFNKPTLLLRDTRPNVRGLAVYIRTGFPATIRKENVCNCHEVQLIRVCSKHNNFYIFSLYRNPNSDDVLYECLLNSMGNIQATDRKSSFIFVGDLNAHHKEWLNSISDTNIHGIKALDFSNLSGCDQLINEPTHQLGNCLDLLFTDSPGVVDTAVKPPLGSSDHFQISFTLKLKVYIPNIQISKKVYLKSRIDWQKVKSDIEKIEWSKIYKSPNSIVDLNAALIDIINRRVPTKIIKKRLKDKPWFNADCINAFNEKQTAYNLWSQNKSRLLWSDFTRLKQQAQTVYDNARSEHDRNIRESLAGESEPHKWWSSLKNFLFGADTTLPPIKMDNGAVTYDPAIMAEIFSAEFQKKQSDQDISLPSSCFPNPEFTYFAFKSSELKYYLNNLDSFGGTDPNDLFPLFFKKIANEFSPKLAKIFRGLLASGSFPECWRSANVTPIPKGGSPTQFPSDYRPISITPILSKVYEKLIAKRLYKYVNSKNILPSTQFGFRKDLGTSDALLVLTQDLQRSLDTRAESRVISLDFSSAFDRVNHKALLYKLKLMGIDGPVFNIFKEFLTNRKQRVAIDGSFSDYKPVISGVPQGSVLGPLLFILYTADMWNNLENKIVSYADDTTLYGEVKSPSLRTSVADSLNRDLSKIQSWCINWGMKLNPKKTYSIIVSRSRTSQPPHPPLSLCGTVLEVSNSLKLLGVTIDDKLTFEKYLRSLASSIAQKTGLLRKCYRTFGNDEALLKSFYAFILPCFEYCSSVWSSAADCHLKLLDRALNNIKFFLPNLTINLENRRDNACLSLLYKIYYNPDHPLHSRLPGPFICARQTRFALAQNNLAFSRINTNTSQYARCFLPHSCKLWNDLSNEVVLSSNRCKFKTAIKTLNQ